MPRVEFLWWSGCPSHERALGELREVLEAAGVDPDAVQTRQVETDAAARTEGFVGSPTILIDGRDVLVPQHGEPTGLTCRVYRLRDGRFSPTPDPEDIRAALRMATSERS